MSGDVQVGGDGADLGDDDIDHVPSNLADHFAGAYRKGAEAFRDGKDTTDCPYPDYRNNSMFNTSWSRVWRKVWFLGYENEEKVQNGQEPEDYRKGPSW